MPLGGLLPYPGEGGAVEDDFDLPVVLDSGDLTDRVHQGADDEMPEDEQGILALVQKLAQKRGQLMPGGSPSGAPPALGGQPPLMPEMSGQVQQVPRKPGLGRALLSGFRG